MFVDCSSLNNSMLLSTVSKAADKLRKAINANC